MGKRDKRELIYRFIYIQKAEFPIKLICEVCEIPPSSYYDWQKGQTRQIDYLWEQAKLTDKIFNIWYDSKACYGAPRIKHSLVKQGIHISKKTIARLMQQINIAGICAKKNRTYTTESDPNNQLAKDLVERNFKANRPNELWVGDITYIPTDQGNLYLASVIDVFSRRLIGYSIADHMRTSLCLDALTATQRSRAKSKFSNTIFHSDHGSQYSSGDFKRYLKLMGVTLSMGSIGDSYDNSLAESFWASLKREVVNRKKFSTKNQARTTIFEWFVWYNKQRLHSSIDYLSPEEFEQKWINNQIELGSKIA